MRLLSLQVREVFPGQDCRSERTAEIGRFTESTDIIILTAGRYEKPDEGKWDFAQLLSEGRLRLAGLEARGLRRARFTEA